MRPGSVEAVSPCLESPGLRPRSVETDSLSLNPRACARGQSTAMSNHHAYQMYAHVTWHTWKRVGCVDAAAASDVRSAIASACQATGVRVFRDAVLANHVHLVVSFRPDVRLSDFVRLAKSVSATRANRRVTGTVRWARGYFVTTIHRRDLPRTTRYVADQFQRHPDLIPRNPRGVA